MKAVNLTELITAHQSLKTQYLACLGTLSTGISTLRAEAKTLRSLVTEMLRTGIEPQTIVDWSKEAGYTKKYIQSLLSRILIELGFRRRKRGAGPKVSQDVRVIIAWVRHHYAQHAGKLLHSAARVVKAEDEAAAEAAQSPNSVSPYLMQR